MRVIALLLSLSACTPTQRTTTLALASSSLILIDWHQTRSEIVPSCNELNPVIGPCGERMHPDTYFPIVALAHIAIGAALPQAWRDVWFGAITGAQLATVWSNYRND